MRKEKIILVFALSVDVDILFEYFIFGKTATFLYNIGTDRVFIE